MTVFFPDTNLFFECRGPSDLPWHELDNARPGEGPDVRLIIPPGVITEIERHKAKGNSRTAKRARDASALLRKALESGDHQVEIRAEGPRITLELPPTFRVDFSRFPDLDPDRPDHRIVGEYAVLREAVPELTLLSDDTLLILAARSLGFNPVLIPAGWKLAPEKDDRDDEIDKLREELRTLKQSSPEISIDIQDVDGQAITRVDAEIENIKPSAADIERVVAEIGAKFPMEEDFHVHPPHTSVTNQWTALSLGRTWRAPTDEEINAYKSIEYPKWLNGVRDKLPSIARVLNEISHEIPIIVLITNSGFVNATQVRLTLSAFDGVTLLPSLTRRDSGEQEELLSLPAPPRAPRGHYVDFASAFRVLPNTPSIADFAGWMTTPPAPDPNSFYYVGGRPNRPAEELELQCAALPHQDDPYELGFRLVIPQGAMGKAPRVRLRVRASNLRKPIERFIPVTTVERSAQFHSRLLNFK